MSSFFTLPASQRKRKRQEGANSSTRSKSKQTGERKPTSKSAQPTQKRRKERDDSISGSESEDEGANDAGSIVASSSGSDEEDITAAERRLKLAERYLENVRADVQEEQGVGFDAADIDRELIAARLKEDVSEEKGRLFKHIARDLDYARASQTFFGAAQLSTTGVAVCLPHAYVVSKDGALVKWKLMTPEHAQKRDKKDHGNTQTQRRRKPIQERYIRGDRSRSKDASYKHHTGAMHCIAASYDGRFIATGGADRKLIVWNPETLEALKVFPQHRDAVTGLAFRGKTNQLFSSSKDRTIKIWSINELAYVETLFGHQDEVLDVAAVDGSQERCVSVGARDKTARLWKVVEESQLVFRGGSGMKLKAKPREDQDVRINGVMPHDETDLEIPIPLTQDGSIDRVVQIDSQLFVTGSDSGALALFALHKKKPLHIVPHAHGHDPPLSIEETYAEMDLTSRKVQSEPNPRWITALASIPFSDLFLSGSWDGCIRVWKISEDQKSIESVGTLGQIPDGVEISSTGDQSANKESGQRRIKGLINDLAVVERGERGKDGICVVAGVGTQPRLGDWLKVKGMNGAFVFEIPRLASHGALATE